ncbi:MAG TPA: hypothetical protein VK772_07485 [Puia sp.]|nr:hypothetical protein [Puia sp.]
MKNSIKLLTCVELLLTILTISIFASCIKEQTHPVKGVYAPPAGPQFPVANAGPDLTIIAPEDSVVFYGTAVTDIMETIARFKWRQLAGPSQSVLLSQNSPTTIVKKLSVSGIYTFELKVIDNYGLFGFDTVNVNVLPIGSVDDGHH